MKIPVIVCSYYIIHTSVIIQPNSQSQYCSLQVSVLKSAGTATPAPSKIIRYFIQDRIRDTAPSLCQSPTPLRASWIPRCLTPGFNASERGCSSRERFHQQRVRWYGCSMSNFEFQGLCACWWSKLSTFCLWAHKVFFEAAIKPAVQ